MNCNFTDEDRKNGNRCRSMDCTACISFFKSKVQRTMIGEKCGYCMEYKEDDSFILIGDDITSLRNEDNKDNLIIEHKDFKLIIGNKLFGNNINVAKLIKEKVNENENNN